MNLTLGELVDRLSIVNVKLYVVQEEVIRAAETGCGLDAKTVARLGGLNTQRNCLVTEIDEALNLAIRQGGAEVSRQVKLPPRTP